MQSNLNLVVLEFSAESQIYTLVVESDTRRLWMQFNSTAMTCVPTEDVLFSLLFIYFRKHGYNEDANWNVPFILFDFNN